MATRDRLLDAAEALLAEGGPRALTLDAVAAAAEVSKGGLLYHFPSKDALVEGLLDRLRHRGADDAAAMRADPDGPVSFYLRTSVPATAGASGGGRAEDAALSRSVQAAVTLATAGDVGARAALAAVSDGWHAVLREAVDDPDLARVVQLVGDGLWLGATTGAPVGDVDALTAAVHRLLAGVGARDAPDRRQ